MRSSAERPSGATSTSYSSLSDSVFSSRSRMLASSSTTSTRLRVGPAAGRAAAAGAGAAWRGPPRGRWLSSHASMSRLRNRHCRPTRTAGILPALMSR